jgi:multimeric flavodoxin WrbA
MKALILSDADYRTDTFLELRRIVGSRLEERGFDIAERRIEKGELAHCMGCFGCWVKKPGECVISDAMTEINRAFMESDAVIYLCPVVFGQASANMKDAIDRWLPNMLPFFITRRDGSTMHPPRYESYPAVVMIGYGDMTAEDARLFRDIAAHRSNMTALAYAGGEEELAGQLEALKLARVGGVL